jgi:hypothetical protein
MQEYLRFTELGFEAERKAAFFLLEQFYHEVVRNYWNEYVNAYILKQGKILTLVAIDTIFMQKTA